MKVRDCWTDDDRRPPNELSIRWGDDIVVEDGLQTRLAYQTRWSASNDWSWSFSKAHGLVVDGRDEFERWLDDHARCTVPIPTRYGKDGDYFDSEFGEDGQYLSFVLIDGNWSGLNSELVRIALKELSAGGEYRTDEYTLYDCLPTGGVLEADWGAILIAPEIEKRDP